MAFSQLLNDIREYYVSRFVSAVNECAAASDVSVSCECAFCNDEGDVVTEGLLDLPARGDCFVIRDGAVVDVLQIDTKEMLSFDPIGLNWCDGDVSVRLAPFQWNWMQLRVHGVSSKTCRVPIRNWFLRWFKDDDSVTDDLLGAVHFMSDPEDGDGFVQFSIDLGTAPVAAIEELLDAAVIAGVTAVEIGQFGQAAGDDNSN